MLVFPTQNHPSEPNPLRDACLNPGAWPTGWSRISSFGNSIQFWAAWTNNAEISQCFTNLRAAGKELVIEAGVLKPECTTAQACWASVQPTLSRLAGLTPPQISLALDEPLTGSEGYASYAYAVDQTGEWIALARGDFPALNLNIIVDETYPHWSAATLKAYFRAVNNEAIVRTGRGIQYANIDRDWNAGGTPEDLVDMQNDVHIDGVGLMVVFWDASPSMDWYTGLMYQGGFYRGWRGLFSPDFYAVQDWDGPPLTTVPESTSGTFTRSVRDFANRFLPVASLPSSGYLSPGQSLTSVDGRFGLYYQSDGNLVLYNEQTMAVVWSSGTAGRSVGFTAMQGDGNLVIYDAGGAYVWDSGTSGPGHEGSFMVVQSDGKLVIYTDYYDAVLWESNVAGG